MDIERGEVEEKESAGQRQAGFREGDHRGRLGKGGNKLGDWSLCTLSIQFL